MSGYEKFFKEAGKAAGLTSGTVSPKKTASAASKATGPLGKASVSASLGSKNAGLDRTGTAEERLRKEVGFRARARRNVAKRKRQKFPLIPAIIAVVALISCTVGFLKPDLADRILSHIEIGAFGQASAAPAKTPETKVTDIAKAPKAAAPVESPKTAVPADFRNWSDDELSFFNKLNDRKKELDLREAEMNKLGEELQKQKSELDAKIERLEAMRADISKALKSRVQVDQEKVDKLVQFYSTMKPQQAAKVLESINEDLAVEVLDKMKKKSAAEIMDMLKPEKARRLSEMLTGYQRSPANDGRGDGVKDEAAKAD